MEAPKIVSQVEVVSRLQDDINLAFSTIEEFLPQIGHSEAKRLFLAATKYPSEDANFSQESEAMIRLYSASKNVKDALVAMGVEVVITKLIENQQKDQGQELAEEGVPVLEGLNISDSTIEETQFYEDQAKLKAAPKKRKTKE